MQYQLQYDLCAVVVYTIVLIAHLMKKKTLERHNRMFTVLVITGLIGVIINILSTSVNMGKIRVFDGCSDILNYGYFIFLNAIPFLYFVYALILCGTGKLRKRKWALALIVLPALIELAVIISNPGTQAIFLYINNAYTRGDFQFILYAASIFYCGFGVVWVLLHRNENTRKLTFALILFCIIIFVTTAIQLYHQEILVQHFGIAICELLIFLNLQKPEECIEVSMGIFNKETFERLFHNHMKTGRDFGVILVYTEDMEMLQQMLGARRLNRLRREIAQYLEMISQKNVYYLWENTFGILCCGKMYQRTQDIIKRVEERFEDDFIHGDGAIKLSCRMVQLDVPGDIRGLDVFYACCSYLRKMKSVGKAVVTTGEIQLDRASREMVIEQCLNHAIKERSFEMYYQPIHMAVSGRLVSAEALIRLKDLELGFLSPDEFIPIAEQNGSIIPIGTIVLEKVFEFISKNNLKKFGVDYVEVNLSVVQCMQENLVSQILELMERYHICKDEVNFEITETAAKDSPKMLLSNMKKLNDAGIGFSLDDFGVGYSNISSMMALPLEIIKFDRSMIEMASQYGNGKTVLSSAAAMVRHMGHKTVAEGVERAEQLHMMQEIGIDYIQGYYFSKPLPEKDFLEYIKKCK